MCILLTTTAHPDFPLLLLSNRDEYLARPTQLATVRSTNKDTKLCSPLDLARPEHGTWIGVSSDGRLAVLVNYREKEKITGKVSRGILPLEYLVSDLQDDEWYNGLEERMNTKSGVTGKPTKLSEIGGFSLLYGQLQLDENFKLRPLNLMSNRGERGKVHSQEVLLDDMHDHFHRQETFGLSNSLYYMPWSKVELGRRKLAGLARRAVAQKYSQEELIESCFEILSSDTYDAEIRKKGTFDQKLKELQNSIFIPPIETPYELKLSETGFAVGKYYGTRTQTVIALSRKGILHYYERDLYQGDTDKMQIREQHLEFDLGKK